MIKVIISLPAALGSNSNLTNVIAKKIQKLQNVLLEINLVRIQGIITALYLFGPPFSYVSLQFSTIQCAWLVNYSEAICCFEQLCQTISPTQVKELNP